MIRIFLASLVPVALVASTVQVTTSQYDNARTGADVNETILNPANVHAAQFGKIFSWQVDGDVYAQPLYLPNVNIPGKGRHNVIVIATEHDSVYAFDAKSPLSTPLWHKSFVDDKRGVTSLSSREVHCAFIQPEIGITATPVIDKATGTLYVVVRTREPEAGGQGAYVQRLHAINVANGSERPGSPVAIRASVTRNTNSDQNGNIGRVVFDPLLENPRAALLLVNGNIWIGWASSCDVGDYHGWMMVYDAHTLRQLGVFNTSPDDSESGIWAGDAGPAADVEGNVFVATGNGNFDVSSGGRDYGDSVLKLGLTNIGIVIRDYFTPFDQEQLNRNDFDLGAGGPVLLPQQPGAHPHVLVIGRKGGLLYVIDRDKLGHFHSGSDTHAVETIPLGGHMVGAPAYWNHRVYFISGDDSLKAFDVANGQLSRAPTIAASKFSEGSSATPTISANGTRNGIVWAIETKGYVGPQLGNLRVVSAVLHAWDALDVRHELYNSDQNAERDHAGPALRLTIPTVADGRVYVGAKREVDVYGLIGSKSHNR